MGETKIEWADATWSPITGCSWISEGCDNCYARRMARRLAGRYGYPPEDPFRVTFHRSRLEDPLRWKEPKKIFVCSMSDLFHGDVAPWWIDEVLESCLAAPQHIYMFLTKRPENIVKKLNGCSSRHVEFFEKQAWLGVTVENQPRAKERIPILLQIFAALRFVSYEPALGPVDMRPYLPLLDWVVAGAETGPGARPAKAEWFHSIIDQCRSARVPVFIKKAPEGVPVIREFPNSILPPARWPNVG